MIWIIGGTVNATDISDLLISQNFPVLVSVTTEYGRILAQQTGAEVISGALNQSQMSQLIVDKNITMVVDASHPFALEVSLNAIAASSECSIPYIRFERPNKIYKEATYLSSYNEVVEYLSSKKGNILLTTGSKHIAHFKPLGADRIVARVLSTASSLAMCEEAGLNPSNIVSLSNVCSKELNYALLKEFNIKYLVTKESGAEGGINEKIEAAKVAGVEVVIIKRPPISYPDRVEDYFSLMRRIKTITQTMCTETEINELN